MDEFLYGRYLFLLGGTLVFSVLALALVLGGFWHRKRIATNEQTRMKQFEKLVATGMFIGAGVIMCMMCLILLRLFIR
jgi:hypothetical protein